MNVSKRLTEVIKKAKYTIYNQQYMLYLCNNAWFYMKIVKGIFLIESSGCG